MATQNQFSLMNDPGYADAYSKLRELNGEYAEIEKHISNLLSHLSSNEHATALKDKKVQAIIDGQNPDEIKSEDYRDSLNKSYERKKLIRAAIDKQKTILSDERIRASKGVTEKVGPKYRDLIKQIAEQYTKLAALVVEEKDLRQSLNDEDIAYQTHGLIPMALNFGDDPREASSNFALWMIESVERGYLSDKDISKLFRESWRKRSGFEFKKTGLAAVLG